MQLTVKSAMCEKLCASFYHNVRRESCDQVERLMQITETDKDKLPPDIGIRHHLKPGDIGYLTYLHGALYAQEYGWDHTFEAYVAGPLAEFAKSHSDRERIWVVEKDKKVAGSIAIVEVSKEKAQLRWLL